MGTSGLRAVAVFLLLSPCALAGAQLVRTGGRLGASVDYRIFADPGELFVLAPSFQTGPTPIALIDPSDPRALSVGIDLIDFWQVGVANAAGFALVSLPLPNKPALSGLPLHAQFVSLPGKPTLIDELSNRSSFRLAVQNAELFTLGPLSTEILFNGLTLLDDGRILVSGGATLTPSGDAVPLDTFEIFDPQTQAFTKQKATLNNSGRAIQASVKLLDGRVMQIGGADSGSPTAAIEIYDAVNDAVIPAAPMSTPRVLHTATLLQDGRVFVVGGAPDYNNQDPLATLNTVLNTTEIYNPATNTWKLGPVLPKGLAGHSATRLANGQVLIVGGVETVSLFGIPIATVSNVCRRYDPVTNSFLAAASLTQERALHAAVALNDGDVLVGGGASGSLLQILIGVLSSCERYDAATNTWTSVAPLEQARGFFNLVNVGSKVVAVNGINSIDLFALTGVSADQIEVADPSISSWSTVAKTINPRALGTAVAFDGGERILILGGNETILPAADPTAEIFHP